MTNIIEIKKLERLAQSMFNEKREEIEKEIITKLKAKAELFSHKGALHSGRFLKEATELHTERIRRFLESRLNIDKEVFLRNQPVKTEDEIKLLLKNLQKIAVLQKSVILSPADTVLVRMKEKEKFIEAVRRKVEMIFARIRRSLMIEKDKQILLTKAGIEKETSKPLPPEIQEFEALLNSIENEKLKKILSRDFRDAYSCHKRKLWKSCVALCGGIIEGVLGVEFSIKGKFEVKIKEAIKKGIISEDIGGSLANVVRLLRNYVHIEKEIKKEGSIIKNDANLSFAIVEKLFYQVKKYKEKQGSASVQELRSKTN